jgi:hypothetical protein
MKPRSRRTVLLGRFFALSFVFCAVVTPLAVCQEAGKIVEQYVKAAGGGKALARIQTLTLEGTFTSDDGKSGTYTLDTKLPNRYYSELLVGEENQIEAYNGKSAWHQNTAGELGTLVGSEGMQLEAAAQYYNSRLLNLKRNKITLMLGGASAGARKGCAATRSDHRDGREAASILRSTDAPDCEGVGDSWRSGGRNSL